MPLIHVPRIILQPRDAVESKSTEDDDISDAYEDLLVSFAPDEFTDDNTENLQTGSTSLILTPSTKRCKEKLEDHGR